MTEGVIRFTANHERAPTGAPRCAAMCNHLTAWRHVFKALGLVGQHPDRYDGLGFGNLSARVDLSSTQPPPGQRPFLITGSQTGERPMLSEQDYCLVTAYDYAANSACSRGQTRPSSESLTHGAIYDLSADIRFVFHAHAPQIWHHAADLGIPRTDPGAAYGSPEMARSVQNCWEAATGPTCGILAMAGHEDGVISFGSTAEAAAVYLLKTLTAALELQLRATDGKNVNREST